MDALYREYIIDHYKNPRNFGELHERDVEFQDRNPLCGDELGVHIRLDGDRVSELRFHGQGCAISQATASIISEELIGKTVAQTARGIAPRLRVLAQKTWDSPPPARMQTASRLQSSARSCGWMPSNVKLTRPPRSATSSGP